jgi:epsilon-lactone hydrolase
MPSPESRHVFELNEQLRDRWNAAAAAPSDDPGGDARRIHREFMAQLEVPADAVFTEVDAGGAPAIWADAPNADPRIVVLHLHAGGYVLGDAEGYRGFGARVSAAAGARALVLDYRLAPENPFPAALEDALAAYDWLLRFGYAPGDIVVTGDSAGGGLVLVLLQTLRDAGRPLPAGAVSISPLADFTASGESMQTNRDADPLVTREAVVLGGADYFGDLDPRDPRVSPLFGEWQGLPPLLFFAGSIERLRDDAKRCAERARAAGVDAEYVEAEGQCHVYPIFADRLPEARDAIDRIGGFVRRTTRAR